MKESTSEVGEGEQGICQVLDDSQGPQEAPGLQTGQLCPDGFFVLFVRKPTILQHKPFAL